VVTRAEDKGLGPGAERLRATGADIQLVQTDLSTYEGVEQLYAAIVSTGRSVSAAALNAGVGQGGAFIDTDLADEIKIIDLNIASTMPGSFQFDALRAGKGKLVAGSAKTKVQGVANKILPDKLKATGHRQIAEPG
jgi:short-subunit dehydrogenase